MVCCPPPPPPNYWGPAPGPPVPTPMKHDCPVPSQRLYEERTCFRGKRVEKKVNFYFAHLF